MNSGPQNQAKKLVINEEGISTIEGDSDTTPPSSMVPSYRPADIAPPLDWPWKLGG